jgi:hypothetical protein
MCSQLVLSEQPVFSHGLAKFYRKTQSIVGKPQEGLKAVLLRLLPTTISPQVVTRVFQTCSYESS